MELIIRKGKSEDISSIISVYSEIELKDDNPLSIQDAENILSKIESYPDYHIYVAEADKNIVGAFELLIMDNLGHGGRKSVIIEDVSVKKEWQRKVICKKMMDYAMEVCRNAGCYKLALSTNSKRESAHKFYESLGYKKHGYSYLLEPGK
jgi:GNAT superfamily N-acetyltransferase